MCHNLSICSAACTLSRASKGSFPWSPSSKGASGPALGYYAGTTEGPTWPLQKQDTMWRNPRTKIPLLRQTSSSPSLRVRQLATLSGADLMFSLSQHWGWPSPLPLVVWETPEGYIWDPSFLMGQRQQACCRGHCHFSHANEGNKNKGV